MGVGTGKPKEGLVEIPRDVTVKPRQTEMCSMQPQETNGVDRSAVAAVKSCLADTCAGRAVVSIPCRPKGKTVHAKNLHLVLSCTDKKSNL